MCLYFWCQASGCKAECRKQIWIEICNVSGDICSRGSKCGQAIDIYQHAGWNPAYMWKKPGRNQNRLCVDHGGDVIRGNYPLCALKDYPYVPVYLVDPPARKEYLNLQLIHTMKAPDRKKVDDLNKPPEDENARGSLYTPEIPREFVADETATQGFYWRPYVQRTQKKKPRSKVHSNDKIPIVRVPQPGSPQSREWPMSTQNPRQNRPYMSPYPPLSAQDYRQTPYSVQPVGTFDFSSNEPAQQSSGGYQQPQAETSATSTNAPSRGYQSGYELGRQLGREGFDTGFNPHTRDQYQAEFGGFGKSSDQRLNVPTSYSQQQTSHLGDSRQYQRATLPDRLPQHQDADNNDLYEFPTGPTPSSHRGSVAPDLSQVVGTRRRREQSFSSRPDTSGSMGRHEPRLRITSPTGTDNSPDFAGFPISHPSHPSTSGSTRRSDRRRQPTIPAAVGASPDPAAYCSSRSGYPSSRASQSHASSPSSHSQMVDRTRPPTASSSRRGQNSRETTPNFDTAYTPPPAAPLDDSNWIEDAPERPLTPLIGSPLPQTGDYGPGPGTPDYYTGIDPLFASRLDADNTGNGHNVRRSRAPRRSAQSTNKIRSSQDPALSENPSQKPPLGSKNGGSNPVSSTSTVNPSPANVLPLRPLKRTATELPGPNATPLQKPGGIERRATTPNKGPIQVPKDNGKPGNNTGGKVNQSVSGAQGKVQSWFGSPAVSSASSQSAQPTTSSVDPSKQIKANKNNQAQGKGVQSQTAQRKPEGGKPALRAPTPAQKPSTPAPKPSTPTPRLSTPAPKPSTSTPKSSSPAPKLTTPAPKPSTPVSKGTPSKSGVGKPPARSNTGTDSKNGKSGGGSAGAKGKTKK